MTCPSHCLSAVPRHHAAALAAAGAGWLVRLLREACRAGGGECDNNQDGAPTHERHETCDVLALQCHAEGVAWRGLAPPLLAAEAEGVAASRGDGCKGRKRRRRRVDSPSRALIDALTRRFGNHICRVDVELALENCREEDAGGRGAQNATTTSSVDDWFIRQHTIRSPNNDQVPLILLVLPPNPHLPSHQSYSRTPSTSPTNLFALRLILLENTMIRLTSLSAYVSTLGGGFFLCRYLSTAVSLARHQQRLALLRNDVDMALKCRINEGYCHIHAGNVKRGRRVIRKVWRDVEQLRAQKGVEREDGWHHTPERELHELTVIGNMCKSALRFAKLVGEARREGEDVASMRNGSGRHGGAESRADAKEGVISSTHDDYQRIRIVQDRRWR